MTKEDSDVIDRIVDMEYECAWDKFAERNKRLMAAIERREQTKFELACFFGNDKKAYQKALDKYDLEHKDDA